MAETIVKHESLLHPEMDTTLRLEDEISQRIVQAAAIARLAENANPEHCGTVLNNAMWAVECLLGDAGELIKRLKDAHEKQVQNVAAELVKQIKDASETEVELRAAGAGAEGRHNG